MGKPPPGGVAGLSGGTRGLSGRGPGDGRGRAGFEYPPTLGLNGWVIEPDFAMGFLFLPAATGFWAFTTMITSFPPSGSGRSSVPHFACLSGHTRPCLWSFRRSVHIDRHRNAFSQRREVEPCPHRRRTVSPCRCVVHHASILPYGSYRSRISFLPTRSPWTRFPWCPHRP